METYLPCAQLPDLDDIDFANTSLYQTLAECGSAVVSAHRRFEAVSADGALATLLDVAVGDPMLLFYTVGSTKNGIPVEYSKAVYRGEGNVFEVDVAKR